MAGPASACCSTTSMAATRCMPRRQLPDFWIGKPIELPGARPLQFEFSQDIGRRLIEWPVDHCIKVLCFYHPDDDEAMRTEQIGKLRSANDAARKVGREILIEIITSKAGPVDDATMARALDQLYDAGLKPDWWKLEPQATRTGWANVDTVIETRDPYCRGVLMLGLDAPHGRTRGRVRRCPRGTVGQGLCRRTDHLCGGRKDVVCWQNDRRSSRDGNGRPFWRTGARVGGELT